MAAKTLISAAIDLKVRLLQEIGFVEVKQRLIEKAKKPCNNELRWTVDVAMASVLIQDGHQI